MLEFIHTIIAALTPVAHAAATYQWEIPFPPAPGGGVPDTTIESVVNYIYTWGLALGGAFAFVRLTIAGIQWGTSGTVFAAGNAKQTMQEVGFGLVILLGSWLLLNTINPQVVNPQIEFPSGLSDVQQNGSVGGGNNNSRTDGASQTVGGASGAFNTQEQTNTAASLGFGSNSVGKSLTDLLQNIPLADVHPDTWQTTQGPAYAYSTEQRQTSKFNPPTPLSCDAIFTSYNRVQGQQGYNGTTKSQPNITTEIPAGLAGPTITPSPGQGQDPLKYCYSLPYKNTNCTPSGQVPTIIQDLIKRWGGACVNAGQVIANLDFEYPQIIEYSRKYGMNPYMTLTLWIEESCAGADPKAYQLGCSDGAYNAFGLKPPIAPSPNRGTPEELCKQLACLFTFKPDPTDFASFMCGWAEGSDKGRNCQFTANPQFTNNVGTTYMLLTQYEPDKSCLIKFGAPGC